jgi:peroxiredoxin
MTILLQRHDSQSGIDLEAIIKPGDTMPDFQAELFGGESWNLRDLRGRIVLLDFWGIWCGPCLQEITELIDVYERFHNRGFEIIGVLRSEERTRQSSYEKLFKAKDIKWRQVYSDELNEYFNVSGIPYYVLISQDGQVLTKDQHSLRANLAEIVSELVSSD